jgi:thiamine-phosphate pyrophosphorylase
MEFPKLYPIIDKATLDARGLRVRCFAGEMARAGVGMVQYRDKVGAPQEVLRCAAEIAGVFAGTGAKLILNDRADLALLAGWDGVHVGQGDMSPADARKVMGGGYVGVSTHDEMQVLLLRQAQDQDGKIKGAAGEVDGVDYIAVGPVFATSSKANAEPVVGLEGVRRARALTSKPIVAIGGITRENARSVMDAGADSVAVIGGLLVKGERPGKVAEDFLEILR